MKNVIASILILSASSAAADPFSGSTSIPDAPAPIVVPDQVKEKHPSLPFPPSVQLGMDLAELRDGINDNAIRADLAMALSTLQIDFTQPNYLAGGLAFHDGSTVGAIGWNHRINNRASVGLMIGSNGSDVVVGINGGFGF